MTSTAQPSTTDEAFLYVGACFCWLVVLPSCRCCACWQWLHSLVVFDKCMTAVGSGCGQTEKQRHSRNGISICKWMAAGRQSVSLVAPCVSYGNAQKQIDEPRTSSWLETLFFVQCEFLCLFIFTTTTMKSDQNCLSSFRFLLSPKFWGLTSTFHVIA